MTGLGVTGSSATNGAATSPSRNAFTRAGLTVAAVFVLALVVGGGLPVAAPDGLQDAGTFTGWALRLISLLANLTAVLTVGSLVVGAFLVPIRPGGRLDGPALRSATHAGRWAAAWTALTVLSVVVTASDVAAVPLADLRPHVVAALTSTNPGRALCLVAVVAGVLAAVAGRATTVWQARVLLLVAVGGLLPTVVTGHASSAADQEVAVSGLVVHVVAAALWTGGLAGVVMHLRSSPAALALAAPRFSTLALASYLALAASGLLAVSARLGISLSAWTSGYGALVVAKIAVLVALGAIGHVHRRRTLPRLAGSGAVAPFLRLAGAELAVMGAAAGLAAALSRTPTPTAPIVPSSHGPRHSTLPDVVEQISLAELATAWRPNALVLVVLGLTLASYVVGVRVLHRDGHRWPAGRSAAFAAGVIVALVNFCSGVATYAPAMVSVQVSQLLIALLLLPALLLCGAPLTLWLEAGRTEGTSRPRRLLESRIGRALANPVTGAAASSALLLAVYRTPLIEVSQRSSWTHLLVLALAVAAGLLLLWPVLGIDPVPEPRGTGERLACLAGVAGCLALLAVQLGHGDRLLAGEWFLELRWGWVDPVADQSLAGVIVGAAAVGLLLLAPATRPSVGRRC